MVLTESIASIHSDGTRSHSLLGSIWVRQWRAKGTLYQARFPSIALETELAVANSAVSSLLIPAEFSGHSALFLNFPSLSLYDLQALHYTVIDSFR